MPNPSPDDDNDLRALVVSLIAMLKSNAEMIADVSAEVSALRGAMTGLDPTFEDILDVRREEVCQRLERGKQQMLAQYDALIRKVDEGEIL